MITASPALERLLLATFKAPDLAPCAGHASVWTSADDIDRALAATICRDHCAFLELWYEAAQAEPPREIHGVWAGHDWTPQQPPKTKHHNHQGES